MSCEFHECHFFTTFSKAWLQWNIARVDGKKALLGHPQKFNISAKFNSFFTKNNPLIVNTNFIYFSFVKFNRTRF